MEAFRETTQPLLRPGQVQEMSEESKRMEAQLNAPPHVSGAIQNKGEVVRQLRALKRQLDTQAPQPYQGPELDQARARCAELEDQIRQGMPTAAEMRRNPAGAVDKHRAWEKRAKPLISEWKNIRLKLLASGAIDDALADSSDVANIERLRPQGASHELNMHNEQIPARQQYGPAPGAGPAAVMSESESALLKELDPELHGRMAMLPNEARHEVLGFIRRVMSQAGQDSPQKAAPEKPKSEMAELRSKAKALGINTFGMKKDAIKDAIAEAERGG